MKQYYISRTGGEIRFSYTPSSTVSWTVTSETPTTGWFTTGATSGVLSIHCGEAVGTDSRSIELKYTVNGVQCNSIKITQNGVNVPCSCSNMPLTWSVDTSTFSSLPSEGTTFYATYDNSQCTNSNVSFEKKYNKSWWTIDDSVDGKVTVTINDVGTRSGDDLFDNIIYKINGGEPACEDTQFRQRSWCSHLTTFGSSLSTNIPQSGMTNGTTIGTWSLDSSTYNNKLTVSSPTLQVTYTNGSIKLNQAIPPNTASTTISYVINAFMTGDTTPCSSFTLVQDSLVCSCTDLVITSDISGNISAENGLPAGTQIGHYDYLGTAACKSKVVLTYPELAVTDTNGVLTLSSAIPPNTELQPKTFTVSAYLEDTGTTACGSFTLTQDALLACGCGDLVISPPLTQI